VRLLLERLEDRTLLSTSIPLSATNWTPIGPASLANGELFSGRISGVATDPTNANTIYIAAASGGVWKTTNGGTSWSPLTDNQATLFMGAIAVAPSNPSVVYAGTGEANLGPSKLSIFRDNIYYGRGVLKSTDAGATWILEGNSVFDRRSISRIVVDPADPNTVYVAVGETSTNGLPGNTGIWKSTDGGTTWTNTTTAISSTAAFSDLAMDPSNNQILYAGVGDPNGNPVNGIYKSLNAGATWALLANFPNGTDANVGRITIAVARTSPLTIYASVAQSGPNAVLYRMMKSTDGGGTWTQLTGVPNYMGGAGDYNTSLAVDPSNANVAYAGGTANGPNDFLETRDGGTTWSTIDSGVNGVYLHGDEHAIAFDASGRLVEGNDGGIWRLENPIPGSIQWTDLNSNLNTIQLEGIALDPTNLNIAYGGSQDNGTEQFNNNLVWNEIDGGDGGHVAVSFTNPLTVYHDSSFASFGAAYFIQRSNDGGVTWATKTTGINSGSEPSIYYPVLFMDPSNSSRLLVSTNRLYETTNNADLWTPISTPGVAGWTSNAPIENMAISKSSPNTIYATAGGHIFVTFNDGVAWQQIDVPGYTDQFRTIAIDPTNNLIAYVGRDQFTGGHIFKTINGGATWTDISGNLPDIPVNALVLDSRTNVIYAGTDAGVYATNNGGVTWAAFGAGMPNARVVELQLNPAENVLAAGTHGRGMFEIATTHLQVTPSVISVASGTAFSVTVTALDPFNSTMTGYTGTVHFTSSDGAATLPADYTFLSTDNGSHTFNGVVLRTLGLQTITATDTVNNVVTGSASVTVTAAALPTLSINNVTAPDGASGSTSFVFTVSLSAASSQTVTVNYATADGTGQTSDGDYTATSGTLTFSPGQVQQTITVMVNGFTRYEPNETFYVLLSNPTNATLANKQGTGTILNDDPAPTFSITDLTLPNGPAGTTTQFNFTVTMTGATELLAGCNFATADGTAQTSDGDYVATSGSLTFFPGDVSQTITVIVNGSSVTEPNETFFVNLTGAFNATFTKSQGVGTILNNASPPKISISNVSKFDLDSGTVPFVFTVSLGSAQGTPFYLNYHTKDGTASTTDGDYVATSGQLVFNPGEVSKTITVLVNGDVLTGEPDENFFVVIGNPTNTVPPIQGTGTILEEDDTTLIGQDAFGYQAVPYTFNSNVLTPGALGVFTILDSGNDAAVGINVGTHSGFNFYGVAYSILYVSSNGLITFGSPNSSPTSTDLTNLPGTPAIAPLWDDWISTSGNSMILGKYDRAVSGTSHLTIQWNKVQGNPTSPQMITFQVILTLGTAAPGDMIFNYTSTDTGDFRANGGNASEGIKDNGTQGGNRILIGFHDGSGTFVATGRAILITDPTGGGGGGGGGGASPAPLVNPEPAAPSQASFSPVNQVARFPIPTNASGTLHAPGIQTSWKEYAGSVNALFGSVEPRIAALKGRKLASAADDLLISLREGV
jgi:hypothetical protein